MHGLGAQRRAVCHSLEGQPLLWSSLVGFGMASRGHLLRLPDELLLHLASHLLPRDLVPLIATCLRLRQVLRDDSIWLPWVERYVRYRPAYLDIPASLSVSALRNTP